MKLARVVAHDHNVLEWHRDDLEVAANFALQVA